ncbi:GNAT family N-acetyltransferase [Streptococcus sp. P25B114]|uniref:GNAT family N-acetyltransferase n=1 Tax=unclassified Streptococcus TaxID=2608887 RepID=UPI00374D57E3
MTEQEEGEHQVLVAENEQACLGYITLVKCPKKGRFSQTGIPEIVDFTVFEHFQGQGIGYRLLDAICQLVSDFTSQIGIGVGLNAHYGKAQKLYVQNGFIPDGTGVWYEDSPLAIEASAYNDDNLSVFYQATGNMISCFIEILIEKIRSSR